MTTSSANCPAQDAQQTAALWIIDAIAHDRVAEFVRPEGAQFPSFLDCFLRGRFLDALRTGRSDHLRRGAGLGQRPQFFETPDSESLVRLAISAAATATGNDVAHRSCLPSGMRLPASPAKQTLVVAVHVVRLTHF